jgi:hypothetical protein
MAKEKTSADQPLAGATESDPALARLQDAQAQYLAALQETWTGLIQKYNETAENYLKAQRELLANAAKCAESKPK